MRSIVIVNASSFIYGAERGLINLIRALRGEFRITVILPKSGPLTSRLKNDFPDLKIKAFPLPVIMLSYSPFYYLGFFLRTILSISYLAFYVIREDIDIICTNSILLVFSSLVAKITKRRHIWHVREFFSSKRINKCLGFFVNNFSDLVICQSKTIREKLAIKIKSEVVYEPLAEQDYKIYDADIVKKELNLPLDSTVISIISRIHPSKGQYEFLQNIKSVLQDVDNLYLLIAGDITPFTLKNRSYLKAIHDFIDENKLDNVILLGFSQDIDKIFSVSDICVFPFLREEPFGIAVAESLAFGNITFFPKKGGLKEVYDIFKQGYDFDFTSIKEELPRIMNPQTRHKKQVVIPEALSFQKYKSNIGNLYRQ